MSATCKGFALALVISVLVHPVHSFAGAYEDGESAFHRKDYADAMKHWQPLAQGDDPRAQAGMAALYLGGLGVPRDYALALLLCEKAAKQGEPKAQYLLGSMYRDGTGVERDLDRAMALYRQAAEQDLHWAQYNLGLMYFLGEGVQSDHLEAYHWLALASGGRESDDSQVRATASYMLDRVSAKLTPEQINQAKQRVSEWKPAPPLRDK
jgi:TPR repeat protein